MGREPLPENTMGGWFVHFFFLFYSFFLLILPNVAFDWEVILCPRDFFFIFFFNS